MNLKQYLENQALEAGLSKVIEGLFAAIKDIASAVRQSDGGKAGTKNSFGEEQLALDVYSDQLIQKEMKKTSEVAICGSEELDEELKIGEGKYSVAYDPLDGSSLVDVNLAVGTICGVYEAQTLLGVKGRDQKAVVVATYGPRTGVFLALEGSITYFILSNDQFILEKENLKIAEEGKMFAPGNLRACSKRKDYLDLLNYWAENQYKLRYSGGMVPDIGQIILKGKGIFTYPGYEDQPTGKLRLLFECAPMAFLVKQAGGYASDGKTDILDLEASNLAQTTPIFIGSRLEVKKAEEYLHS
jgi:fructose-1,6-bisphosphatase I